MCILQITQVSAIVNHTKRWNYTLRQRLARYIRKTLSFSKADYMRHLVTRWFIVEYNLNILAISCNYSMFAHF